MNEEPGAPPPESTPSSGMPGGIPPSSPSSSQPGASGGGAGAPYYNAPVSSAPVSDASTTDKVIGIIIMVFSACGVAGGLMMTAGGGILGVAGAGAVSGTNASGQPINNAAAAGVAGGIIAAAGIIVALLCAFSIFLGFGIMKSRKWAFLVGSILYGLSALGDLAQITKGSGIVGFVIAGALCAYCIMRITGKYGAVPA